ncbi:MAG: C13 family peptidase [Betaproteobacteria bacterium]
MPLVPHASEPLSESSPPGSLRRSFVFGLIANLRAGARLATLRSITPDALYVSVEQLAAQVVLDIVLSFMFDFFAVGVHGRFNTFGIPGAIFYLPCMLLAGYAVGRFDRTPGLALKLCIAWIAASQYVSLLSLVLSAAAASDRIDYSQRAFALVYEWAPFAWWLIVLMSSTLRITYRGFPARLVGLLIAGVLVVVPNWYLPRAAIGPLWVDRYDDEPNATQLARYGAVASEQALYAQPRLLQHALNAVKRGVPGREEIYFIGVAGYAEEDVFLKELSVITRLFEQRFGTAGRSITLVNNPDTVLDKPIASITSLQRALNRMGEAMNRDEDIVFLYLTSHGSEDHRFALDFRPLRLHSLEPPALRSMLDESGIRWRVIVISACYAGGFIDALKDDHTLVITAADATHTSFGCGSASDFTYFGKAYFDQALRQTRSFVDAFALARRTIEERERLEGITRSYPQMFVGSAIEQKLAKQK